MNLISTIRSSALAALAAAAFVAAPDAFAAPANRVAGSGPGGASMFATDAYPGFDGIDDMPKPEKKETSWFLHVSCDTPAEQLAWAEAKEAEGSLWSARRGYDALVREWPASPEAPKAQLALARLWSAKKQDYGEAVEALDYLLDFYPTACAYRELVDWEYKLVNMMLKERRTFLGFSMTSLTLVRQAYERVVRRAPGASYAPEAMLRIAGIREDEDHWEEAAQVYSTLVARYPETPEAKLAIYRGAKARMWLVRRLAYNDARRRDVANHLRMCIRRYATVEGVEEMKEWLAELEEYHAEEAWTRTKFYDSKRRTAHAALSAYERFLREYPDSTHADEARARIGQLRQAAPAAAPSEKKGE